MMTAKSFVRPLALMGLVCACTVLPGRSSAQEPLESPQQREERELRQLEEELRRRMEQEHRRKVLEELVDPRLGGAVIVGGWERYAFEAEHARSLMAWFFGPSDAVRVESTFGPPTNAQAVQTPAREDVAPAPAAPAPSKGPQGAKIDTEEYARRMAAYEARRRGPAECSLERQRFLRLIEEPYLLVLAVEYEKGEPVGSGWAFTRRWASFDLALEEEVGLSALKALRSGRPKEASALLPRDRFEEAYAAYRRTNPAAKRVRMEMSPGGTAPELFIMESLGVVLEPAHASPGSERANLARPGIEGADGNGLKVVGVLGDLPGASAPLIRGDIILAVSPVEPPGGRPLGMLVAKKPVITVEREGRSVEITAADLPEVMTLRHLLRTVQGAQKTE